VSFSRSSYVFFFAPLVVACGGTAQAPEQRYAVVSLDLRPSSSGQLAAEAFGVFGTYDDGPCAPETIGACVVDACRRDFAYHDGGALRVESEGTLSMSVPRASDGRYSGPSAAVGALPAAGSAVRFTTDGAEVPPLDATLRFPAPIRLENPSPVSGFTSGTSNATLAYEGGGDVEIRFAPAAESSLHGKAAGSPSVACTWDGAAGRAVLPAAVLARLAGRPLMLRTTRQVTERVGAWNVAVVVGVPALAPLTAAPDGPVAPAEVVVRPR